MLIACLLLPARALAADSAPKDVQNFIRNAEACEQFAGDFDSGLSEQRQRELERAVVRHCRAAQGQLRQLEAKYKDNPRLAELIRAHANESVTSFR
jgi:hypothetical protein